MPNDVQLHGYVGNGILEIADGLQNSLLTTATIPDFFTAPSFFSIDVTGFLATLVAADESDFGFMLRQVPEPSINEKKMNRISAMLLSGLDPNTAAGNTTSFLVGWPRCVGLVCPG